jgi:hypothetical protein
MAHPLMLLAIAAAQKKIGLMPARSLTATSCRNATSHRPRFGTDGEPCATVIC